jgi:phospholipid/cholesterol/gamma-HCH transport system substrate-binding protein
MREISPIRAIATVVLALLLAGVAAWGATLIARRHWSGPGTFLARAQFARVSGLSEGDRVLVQGMDAGVVSAIEPPAAPGGMVGVVLKIDRRLRGLVRADAVASIETQGVVGARVVEITPGAPDGPPLGDGVPIRSKEPIEVAELLEDARAALARVESVAEAAETGLSEVNAIASSIRRGEGSLGKLVRDQEAYDRLIRLTDRGEKAVVALDENLQALKGLWPISGYFRDRGFQDIEKVLYRPGSTHESRSFPAEDLFRPGTAILTDGGRSRLDEFARWFKDHRWDDSTEVVVAAYTDGANGPSNARILTQEQAQAVRAYLDDQHNLFSLSWFRKRKSAAVGFGTSHPQTTLGALADAPSKRVDVVLFTPQG